ncbi:hypothetical protein [Novosphingobium sp.]|uniref:hypothetical protein n=1 Tax=Novosphingobium sp. TaxID=1874826 RepID=UPI0025E58F57|nr:hypothetical protein [Novosphingobium sp.]
MTASMLCRSGFGRCATREAPLSFRSFSDRRQSDLLTARHSLHLRFAALDPKIACGVFSDAAAGIAARSLRYVFPFRFSGFPHHLQVRFHRLDKAKLRFKTESHKQKMTQLSTIRRLASGQVCG